MKKGIRLFTTLMVCMAMALCVSCKKDEKVYVAKVQAETPDVTTTANAADISGTYSYASRLKSVVIAYGKDASLSSPQKVTAEHTRDSYSVTINNLDPSTTYYYHCIFDTGYGASESEQRSFTTQATVTTAQVSDITQTTATCGGNVTSNGSVAVTARGVCWSTSPNPTVSDSHTADGSGTGSFTSNITGLTANTTYYVRAYATNSAGTSYGEQRTFTTQTTPTVTTSSVSNISQTTATCGGNVTSDGGAAVTARGVCWSTLPNPTVSDSHTTDGSGTGSFTSSITGLTANTTYYVRAYATNSAGTSYGEQRTFTTQGGGGTQTTPTVTTSSVSNITQTTATCGGNVTSDGGATVTARGVCWSTSQNPTVSNSHTTDGSGTGSFTSSITGLTANRTYYVRAYATNSAGTSYGEQRTFTTQGGGGTQTTPTVTTSSVSNITQTTATCGGNVTSDGGAAVTVRGVCWSTSQNPTVSDSHTADGSGTGSFTSSITGLTAYTTYYVRAYATNSAGTSYGEQESFTTLQSISVPTVTTSSVSNITQTTATCGGNVTSDGGAAVTARGVCWSTSQNPTVSDSHTTDGSGTGSFTSSITGLTANTTYYVRAYATNSAGTSYGEQRTFTTQSGGGTQTVPTVTTSQVSNITHTTATCGGEVTSDGGSTVTARGVCWSTSQNPTVSDSHTTDGSGTGSFTSSITGLTANTTYYVRAYATNSAGTSYGEQKSFTTQSGGGGGQTQAFTVNGVTFEMVAVEGGTFIMGGTPEQGSDAYDNEFPTHSVTLSDYCIGKFEVTQELWLAVMGSWPGTAPSVSCGLGDDYPAYYVSWNDCQEFITELNQLTGRTFRLPTEAEWEYAARGGNMSGGYKYSGSNSIGEVAWYYDNSGGKTHTVGTKSPNELGIYDMSGNVWEWCQDWYGSYSSGSQTDPQGPSSGSYRVLRGGCWCYYARYCRVSNRNDNTPGSRGSFIGFRLVLVP